MNDIVASCLQRLFVLQCSSSLNLIKSLSFLEKFLNENPEISVLMLDNISEFYWMDRAIGGIGRYEQETNQRSIISKLRKYQKTHSLVILLVKSAIMNKQFHIVSASNTMQGDSSLRSPDDYLSPEWNRFVTYKYLISKKIDYERAAVTQTWYFASMNKKDITAGCKFIITDAGIEFLPNGPTSWRDQLPSLSKEVYQHMCSRIMVFALKQCKSLSNEQKMQIVSIMSYRKLKKPTWSLNNSFFCYSIPWCLYYK